MTDVDLETFKKSWQDHHRSAAPTRDDDALTAMLASVPGTLDAQLRRSAWVDAAMKGLLLLSAVAICVLYRPAGPGAALVFAAIGVSGLGLLAQLLLLPLVPKLDLAGSSTIQVHRTLLRYFQRFGLVSALVHSLTAPLLFVVGSTIYRFAKYGAVPTLDSDDLLVVGLGTMLAFMLHFLPLRWLQKHQQRYLQITLDELERDEVNPARVSAYRGARDRWTRVLLACLALGLALIVAVLLLR